MRIKTTATNIDLDLEEIRVSWDKKARKREAAVLIELPEGFVVEVTHDGRLIFYSNNGAQIELNTTILEIIERPLNTVEEIRLKQRPEPLPWERPCRNPYESQPRAMFDEVGAPWEDYE